MKIPISRIMQTKMLTCPPETRLHTVAKKMQLAKYSSIVIIADNRPIGIWTEADALKLNPSDPSLLDSPISEFMSTPVATIIQDASVDEVVMRLQQENFRHLIVVDSDGCTLGIVTQSDIISLQNSENCLYTRTVAEIIKHSLLLFFCQARLQDVITKMRIEARDACAISFGSEKYGILTERDVIKILASDKQQLTLKEVVKPDLLMINDEQTLITARDILLENHIRHLGIKNKANQLIAILSFNDILRSIQLDHVRQLKEALRQKGEALKHVKKELLLAHNVVESASEGMMVVDTNGLIEMVNPAFSKMTGYSSHEVIGKTPTILKSGYQNQLFYQNMWQQLDSNQYWQGEIWNRKKTGEIYPEWLTITAIVDSSGIVQGYSGVFTDITERKKVEERIKNLAYYDTLTELPNRRLFDDRFAIAISNAKRHKHQLGLMFLDLDLFKRINDSLGHAAGDMILQKVARRLKDCIREGDILARIGGDEFTIVLPYFTPLKQAIF